MKRTKTILLVLGLIFLIIFSGCDQQNGDPVQNQIEDQSPAVSDTIEEPAADLEFELPDSTPDPKNGELIFNNNCFGCHGETGLLDSSFSTAPVLSYITISEGEGSEMPSYADILDVQSRWDVLAYINSLGLEITELRMGKAIFEENCSTCHGEDGTGGVMGESHMTTDFTDLTIMAMLSTEYVYGAITPGIGNDIHVVEGLDDFTRDLAASYVRTLTFPFTEEIVLSDTAEEDIDTEEEVIEEVEETVFIDVEGLVINGVTEEVVAEQLVTLVVLNHMTMEDADEYEGTTNSDGEYSFTDIEVGVEALYFVYTDFQDISYQSDFNGVSPDFEQGSMTIEVFESTTDLADLAIEEIEVFFFFDNEETIIIQENWYFSNSGTKTILPPTEGSNMLKVNLPADVTNMGFSEYSTIQELSNTDTGFQIEQPFPPGEDAGYIMFAYEVPYTNKYEWIRATPVTVNSASAFIPTDTVSIKNSDATFVQERMFNNTPFDAYEFEQKDGVLTLKVKGKNPFSDSSLDQDLIMIIVGGFLLGVVLIGFVFYMRRTKKSDSEFELLSTDEIMDQIIALDEAFENGGISEDDYNKQRDALKELMQVTLEDDQS